MKCETCIFSCSGCQIMDFCISVNGLPQKGKLYLIKDYGFTSKIGKFKIGP
jgi:hypothetical protein